MGHGLPTREEQKRHEKEQASRRAMFASMAEEQRRYDGLKSVATSAHVALTEALPYVNNDGIKDKIKATLKRLNLWGAHP